MQMQVLVAFEESQVVTAAFRAVGHEAYSADILEPSGGHPEWHIQGDATPLLLEPWDMVIAHPPCTYLANSGVRWLHERPERWDLMRKAAELFQECLNANAPLIAVENPTMHKYAIDLIGRKPDCAIQPYQFGVPESKRTCWWLKGLPVLLPTQASVPYRQSVHMEPPGPDRQRNRSRFHLGVAAAMAKQWG